MSFFNDECDLVDDDQYDLFTSTNLIQRHNRSFRDRGAGRSKPGISNACELRRPATQSGNPG